MKRLAVLLLCGACGGSSTLLTGEPDAGGSVGPAGAVCGNGVREAGEQCDDGNTANLDGCDSTCHFEQAQRATSVKLQFATDSFCTANALGGALTSNAQGPLQAEIDAYVKTGAFTLGFSSATWAISPAPTRPA